MDYKKLINEAQNNNIADMYDTFSHILSEKVIDGIAARKMNITSNLIKEDCGCENCDCKDKKVTCSKCNGEGCEHCDDKGYHLVDESVTRQLKRQLKNSKTEIMVVDKKGNVITINRRDLKKYIAKGYGIAESVELDEEHMMGKTVLVAGRKGKVIKFLGSEYGTEQYKVKLEDGSVITASSIEMETTDPIGLDEAKGMTFVFPDERKAKQFELDIENSSIGMGDRAGNKVTVTGVTGRWRAAVKKAMLKSKGKIVKESVELDEKVMGAAYPGGHPMRKFETPASPEMKKHIESGKAKILLNVQSVLGPTTRFVVIVNPKFRNAKVSGEDKVLMATISDPKRGRIKMFAFHGSHVSHQKAMQFAKNNKLVAKEDAKGKPLYAKESVEHLDESLTLASDDLNAVKKTAQKLAKQSPDLTYYVVKHKTRFMKGMKYAYYEVYQSVDIHLIKGKATKVAGYGAKVDMRESVDEVYKPTSISSSLKSRQGVTKVLKRKGIGFHTSKGVIMVNPKNLIAAKSALNKEFGGDFEKNTGMKLKATKKAGISEEVELIGEVTVRHHNKPEWLKKAQAAKGGGDNTAAIAKQVKQAVKKYTTGKLVVRSKGGKTRFIMVRADKIDNELRKKVLNVVAPTANVRDKSNISYGNISDRIISASVEQWMKALGLKESMINEGKKFTKRDFSKLTKQELELLSMGFAMFTDGGPIIDAGNIHFITPEGLKQTLKGFEKEKRSLASQEKKILDSIIKKTKPLIEQNHVGSIINQLQDSHMLKMPVDININGNIIHVTPDISENLINLHDELNEDNQIKMRNMLMSDSKSFVQLTRFAEER